MVVRGLRKSKIGRSMSMVAETEQAADRQNSLLKCANT
jgi:hypothetical protein